jgi:hypothetical protein
MPLAWINNLRREDAEKLANELNVPTQGILDELRKKLREKWKTLEAYLPPQSSDKSGVTMQAAVASDRGIGGYLANHLTKLVISRLRLGVEWLLIWLETCPYCPISSPRMCSDF